ncbi:sugar ABC transporter substrate-binding protein [Paenibacillus zeisoli]|uniref:Sugar ABC transporter substrate-binding protein n=1 Tax=Paenibacillus zeisoli TaxID=2496267 RepID=A0A3S1B744_9BACL|nr:substrate-binding domain-containing protein [Paenibacillus zeisoli]RUT29646.1 sugar ABC transporter substrate-binding protein [Paenibacillus zeisoli]
MKKSAVKMLVFLMMFTLVVTGCGEAKDSKASGGSDGKKKIVIGFSQTVMNHPFRIANVDTAKKAAADLGVELIVTDGQGDASKEIANIESLIARKVDAIIVSSLSGNAIYPAYKEADRAKIPLIIAASGVPEDDKIPYTTFVASDEVLMGQQAAKYIADKLGNKGNLVILNGVVESTNSQLRTKGFMPEIKKYPDIKIVAEQSGEWLRLPAMQVMTNILQANSNIDVVFAQNDEMALGAIEAIKKAGRMDKIKVVSMDSQKEALEKIKNTNELMMTVKNEWSFETAVKLAIDAANGKEIQKRVILDSPVIDKSNVDKYYDPKSTF